MSAAGIRRGRTIGVRAHLFLFLDDLIPAVFGRPLLSALYPLLRYINLTLRNWVMRKFKRFAASKSRAGCFLKRLARENADLFVHWRIGMTGTFA
jgi:RNA-directed DNA polymerase